MRVAIVHDWLLGMRGGERILNVFCKIFPQAELFTLIHDKGSVDHILEERPIHTSFLQNLPGVKTKYRNYLPLFPLAVESFDLEGFDLVVSSSHCVAKGARSAKDAKHFCYCYTPMRYMWVFFDQYFGSYPPWKKSLVWLTGEYLKRWDIATLPRVDEFIAISRTIKDRIQDIYKRDSTVIYPPVEI
ncbi:MAG: glycosyltransferase, partial [Candidatus Omnitrophica bacterium]|nr:glycosyltransferase [Candidatus Omnitrophota bacterium]